MFSAFHYYTPTLIFKLYSLSNCISNNKATNLYYNSNNKATNLVYYTHTHTLTVYSTASLIGMYRLTNRVIDCRQQIAVGLMVSRRKRPTATLQLEIQPQALLVWRFDVSTYPSCMCVCSKRLSQAQCKQTSQQNGVATICIQSFYVSSSNHQVTCCYPHAAVTRAN